MCEIEVLTAITMKITLLWDVTKRRPLYRFQHVEMSSKLLEVIHETTRRHIPKDSNPY
jgi:hypothetical protein